MKLKNILPTLFSALLLTALPVLAQTANHIVISEVYGGGGNSGATLKNDFIELYNPTTTLVDLTGWSVQYNSATGASSWQVTNLAGIIAPHGFFLIQEAIGSGGSQSLPTPDATGSLALSSTAGKVALANSTNALSGAVSSGSSIVDMVGYGSTANAYEGSGPAPAPSNTTSIERKANNTSTSATMGVGGADELAGNGYDSNNNSSDFITRSSPQPQNSASPAEPSLSPTGSGIGTAQITPTVISAGQTSDFTIKLVSDASDTIANIFIVVPSAFTWSMSVSYISLSGGSLSIANISMNQDTIVISSAKVTSADTAWIVIHSVMAPDSAVTKNFIVETAVNGVAPSMISSQLAVTVTKVVRIIDLHINDSQGVPVAPYQMGAVVTVTGIITANFVGTSNVNLFIQDATAGINVFINSLNSPFQVGDSVTFTGTIDQYRGTTEIDPDSSKWIIYSHNNTLPEPLLLTCADVDQTFNDDYTEPNEGRLVRINGVTYNAANTTITDITGTTGGYIPASLGAPAGTFDIIGILKQYKPGSPAPPAPYTADYEVDTRAQSDIITSAGPAFVESPTEEDIQPNSVTIVFKTALQSSAVVRYGTSSTYTDSVVGSPDTMHAITLSGLQPATAYHYQAVASDTSGANQTGDAIFSTESPSGTTGTMDVYFNKSVDISVSRGENAQTVDIVNKFLARIDSAKYSIDLALYSFSGSVGSTIATHLLNAKTHGVKIRMIVENDNAGTAPMTTMKNNVPFITDTFDPINAGNGLMHNKFAIFDFRDTSSFTDDWVWTGSWNATDPGDNDDAQNSIEIQDKALANAYTMEFNEMWGSSTDTPNASDSRFGADKSDITPHKFNIEGTPVELYFSPSDQTTLHIYETLSLATSSINICMLTFTRADLAGELVLKKAAGDKVRVVMDNNTDSGNQFAFLQSNGIDVHLKGAALGSGLLHHKYAVIDAENPSADEIVITGSHNWSTSAETANNENTLIIHSSRIANLYLQEFKARYLEAGGTDNIVLGVKRIGNELPTAFGLDQNYPNPFNPTTVISYRLAANSQVTLRIFDVLGRRMTELVNQRQPAGYYTGNFNANGFASGVYFYMLQAGGQSFVKKLMLIK